MKVKLNFFEKLALHAKGVSDAKKSSITYISPTDSSKTDAILSTCIANELSDMCLTAKRVFLHRLVVVELRDDKGKKQHRIMRFSNALSSIAKSYNELCLKIKEIKIPYDASIDRLSSLRETHNQKNALHLVSMYDNKIIIEQNKKNSAVLEQYKALEALLNEKIRLLENAFIIMESVKSKSFFRIQYYYNAACKKNKALPVVLLSMHNYVDRIDMSFFNEYKNTLEQAKEKLALITDMHNRAIGK